MKKFSAISILFLSAFYVNLAAASQVEYKAIFTRTNYEVQPGQIPQEVQKCFQTFRAKEGVPQQLLCSDSLIQGINYQVGAEFVFQHGQQSTPVALGAINRFLRVTVIDLFSGYQPGTPIVFDPQKTGMEVGRGLAVKFSFASALALQDIWTLYVTANEVKK